MWWKTSRRKNTCAKDAYPRRLIYHDVDERLNGSQEEYGRQRHEGPDCRRENREGSLLSMQAVDGVADRLCQHADHSCYEVPHSMRKVWKQNAEEASLNTTTSTIATTTEAGGCTMRYQSPFLAAEVGMETKEASRDVWATGTQEAWSTAVSSLATAESPAVLLTQTDMP